MHFRGTTRSSWDHLGAAKTTALRTIAGLNNAEIGRIECDGELWFEANKVNGNTTSLNPAGRSCGFLFQQYALFPRLSALDNVFASPCTTALVILASAKH
ncbi:hypothetical protein [Polynucleobacter necessarius]|uniref:hypothetical protein n=1 Tax=Polynucleobacter necessarius TaxID=576610 RepID=UPI000E09DA7F|nr:hypothetical protein [Polynucleobacter necessarius]